MLKPNRKAEPLKRLAPRQIERIFKIMDLDTEEKRRRFLDLAENPKPEPKNISKQIFVRATSTTTEENEAEDAQLA
jgi:hypothetical protein